MAVQCSRLMGCQRLAFWTLAAFWLNLWWHPAFVGTFGRGADEAARCRVARKVRERRAAGRAVQQRRGNNVKGSLDPRQITVEITKSASASDLLGVVRQERNNPKLDFIALAAAWARMAKMQQTLSETVLKDPVLQDFIALTQDGAKRARVEAERNARAVANTFWAVAKLDEKLHVHVASLQSSLAQAAKQTAAYMEAQQVANMIWGTATLVESGGQGADDKHAINVRVCARLRT